MKKISFATMLFALTVITVKAQSTFQKTLGGTKDDGGYSVERTTDGGYAVIGSITNASGNTDVYLIKMNDQGDTLWTKTYGGTNTDEGKSVKQTTDGGYIITGSTLSFGAGKEDIYIIKTNAQGDTSWTRTIGGSEDDFGFSIQQTSDGGYVIAGNTRSFGSGKNDVYLIKVGANGNISWTKTYGGTDNDYGYSLQQTTDGGYIIAGRTLSFGASYDVYLIKTDAGGDILWTKTYGGIYDDAAYCIQQTADGGYIAAGDMTTFGASYDSDVYLIKTDAGGDTLWTKTYGGTGYDMGSSAGQTTDGGYLVSGQTSSFGTGTLNFDVYLIKTNAGGNVLWSKTFGGTSYDMGSSAYQTADGGYIVTGSAGSFGAGLNDFYLIKTDANGNCGCNQINPAAIENSPATTVFSPSTLISSGGIAAGTLTQVGSGGVVTNLCGTTGVEAIVPSEETVTLFPNPSNGKFTIQIDNRQSIINNCRVEVYNVFGEKVYEEILPPALNGAVGLLPSGSEHLITLSLGMGQGIYCVQVQTEQKIYNKKVIVE